MIDIVEELRQHPTTLAHDAADEIERLRRERDEQDRGILASSRLLADNAAEIEKLQAQVVAQTTDNPITRAVGWWEGPIPAAGRADDAKVMRIWRECELPEYFLGNGGSNHKLVAFVKACAADEIERLRAALLDLVSDCEEYARINNLHNSDGSPATNHAMRRARAALGEPP